MAKVATGDELLGRAAAAARLLSRAGARPGRPLVALTRSSEALALLAYASAALRAPLFPIDPSLPETIRTHFIGHAGEPMIVGDGQNIETGAFLSCETASPLPYAPPAGTALLIATSGSTGAPKAAMLSGANLAASAAASAAVTPLGPGDRWLASLPLFHIGGFSILSRCAFAGADFVLEGDGFDPERILATLASERISHVSLTPAMLAQLVALGAPPPSLRHTLVGGASLSSQLAAEAASRRWPIQPTYGMTETCSQLATSPRLPDGWRAGQVGKPLPGFEIALTPEGRLKARGAMVMQGYANPALAPGDGLADGWFVTNDLAEISAEGELTILGRADDVIVTGGKKVHPATVENLLAACPGLDRFAVTGRPDPVWGEIVTVIYSGPIDEAALLDWSRANISGAHRPRFARRVEALPILANGKIDRVSLRRLALGRDPQTGAAGQ